MGEVRARMEYSNTNVARALPVIEVARTLNTPGLSCLV